MFSTSVSAFTPLVSPTVGENKFIFAKDADSAIKRITKAMETKKFIKVVAPKKGKSSHSFLSLSGAPTQWKEHPDWIYNPVYMMAGPQASIFQVLTALNVKSDDINNSFAASFTLNNYSTTMKDQFEKFVKETPKEGSGMLNVNSLRLIANTISQGNSFLADVDNLSKANENGNVNIQADAQSIIKYDPKEKGAPRYTARVIGVSKAKTLAEKYQEALRLNKNDDGTYTLRKIVDISNKDNGSLLEAKSKSKTYFFLANHTDVPLASNSVERYINALKIIYANVQNQTAADNFINAIATEFRDGLEKWRINNGLIEATNSAPSLSIPVSSNLSLGPQPAAGTASQNLQTIFTQNQEITTGGSFVKTSSPISANVFSSSQAQQNSAMQGNPLTQQVPSAMQGNPLTQQVLSPFGASSSPTASSFFGSTTPLSTALSPSTSVPSFQSSTTPNGGTLYNGGGGLISNPFHQNK